MRIPFRAIVLAAALGSAAGCSVLAPQEDPTRFYVLTSAVAAQTDPPPAGVHVVVGPVVLPDYLNRPQVVTRSEPHRIDIAEFDRWAEPLPSAFVRVLGQNLRASLGPDAVGRFPWASPGSGYQLEVDVLRFESTGDGAELSARWSLRDGNSKEVLVARESSVKRPAASADMPSAVAALSECLGDFSVEVAQTLVSLRSSVR
jgi:uncharacterized lipoprotein YmbA